MKNRAKIVTMASAAVLLFSASFAVGQVAVTTYLYDNYHSGLNTKETTLTPSNVNEVKFGRRLKLPVTGYVYAQPLYVPGVTINGTSHNVVYVVTEHDQVYAFDAHTGALLWQKNFLISSVGTKHIYPIADTDVDCNGYGNNEIGISSTPVIDLSTNQMYVLAATKEVFNGVTTFYNRLHILDISTGAEKSSGAFFGAPIRAKVAGTGSGSVDGYISFDPTLANQRASLTLANGMVFATWGAYCDAGNFHGWLMAFDKLLLRPSGVLLTTPNAYEGGMWASGSGVVADSSNDVYFATGNGYFDVNTGGVDYGDSVMRVSLASGRFLVKDYFAPWDQGVLNSYDLDVASGGVLLLPDQPGSQYPHLLLQVGKEGTMDLINRDNMGHYSASGDTQIVQTVKNVATGVFGSPTMWNNNIYIGGKHAPLLSFHFDPVAQLIQTPPTSQSSQTFNYPGSTVTISANGTNNAIAWIVQSDAFLSGHAVLRAYDANNLATEFYNSEQNQARDQGPLANKFAIATVADGMVFIAGHNEVDVYGLLQ